MNSTKPVLPTFSKIAFVTNQPETHFEVVKLLSEWANKLSFHTFESLSLSDPREFYSLDLPAQKNELSKLLQRCKQELEKACIIDLNVVRLLLPASKPRFDDTLRQIGLSAFLCQYKGVKAESQILVGLIDDEGGIQFFEGVQHGSVTTELIELPPGETPLWEDAFVPEGYSRTLTQMAPFKYCTGVRTTPFLEMASVMRKHEYEGIFEVHVTVANDSHENEERFKAECERLKVKPVLIQLPSGTYHKQLMTGSYHRGQLLAVHKISMELSQKFAKLGFDISRTKIESMMGNKGVPASNEEVRTLSRENYFEFHIKLQLPSNVDQALLKSICQKHDAHLSSNAFKRCEDGKTQRFVTQRMYDVGKEVAEGRFNACLADLEAAGWEVMSKLREYSVYDSNVKLDTGWIDRKKLTASGTYLTSSNAGIAV